MHTIFFTHGTKGFPHIGSFRYHNPWSPVWFVESEEKEGMWSNHDRTIRNWWKEYGKKITSDYVWIFEWDCLVRTDLSKINLNYDLHVAYPRIPGIHDWQWWQQKSRFPVGSDLRRSLRGMVPMGNFAIRREAMDRLAEPEWDWLYETEIYSELRFPTHACHIGLTIIQDPALQYCGHIPITGRITKEGIFHPVKI